MATPGARRMVDRDRPRWPALRSSSPDLAGARRSWDPRCDRSSREAGARGSGTAEVLGVCFLFIAVLIAYCRRHGQLSAERAEEAEGRLDNILVCPVARSTWLVGRTTVAVGAIVASGIFAGIAAWFVESSQHAGVSFVSMLDAGLNVVPPAIAILGLGTLALGISPRRTSVLTYAVLALVAPHRHRRRDRCRQPLAARHLGVSPNGIGACGGTQLASKRGHGRGRNYRSRP